MTMPILMPGSVRTARTAAIALMGAALCLGCLLLSGCNKTPSAAADPAPGAKAPAPGAKAASEQADTPAANGTDAAAGKDEAKDKQEAGKEAPEVALTPEQVGKLGLVTEVAQATEHMEEVLGYGVVVAHETIATAAAELTTAQASQRLSQSALSRAKRLSGTPGAVSADVEETALHQSAVDAAALTLTKQRLSSTLGMKPPWKTDDNSPLLQDLASGRMKLVRVTFPLGALSGGTPKTLRATHISAGKDQGWKTNMVWDAPADAAVPGRSFFAILKNSDAGEGERLMVWAPVGETVSGVIVPATAVVLSDGKYWCYVEEKPGTYVRTAVDTARPTSDGYFVTADVMAGDKIVVTAAGQLLAKESGSGAEPD
ncbi:MAG: hypothetical protein M3O41_12760 [Pseudomonadota bacterium]|nr:hypothetical protein [Pseudomonadota bacterium]